MKQQQKLSQKQIISLKLLAFCNAELNQFLEKEYLENPLLEYIDYRQVPTKQEELKEWYNTNDGSIQDRSFDFINEKENIIEKNSLQTFDSVYNYIFEQIEWHRYSKNQIAFIQTMIQNMDSNGYLTFTKEEIKQYQGLKPQLIEECLKDLRKLDPCGIFAFDLKDCLLLQIERLNINDDILKCIILNHLPDISAGRISGISRALKLSTTQVKQYISLIASLNPRPLQCFEKVEHQYIVPDMIVTLDENREWLVDINDSWCANYQLNDYYVRMMAKTKEPELIDYFKKNLNRARFLIQAVEQRRNTMIQITKCILDKQDTYFKGHGTRKPFTMKQIAEELQISTSTISRAVRSKYLQYPGGCVLMRKLFSTTVSSKGQEPMNADQVKILIRDIVEGEDKNKPYSDAKLAELLLKQGYCLSRRVITKYRNEMGIRDSFLRKR